MVISKINADSQILVKKQYDELLKVKTSYGHAIALWNKRCGIDQKRLII